jgi:hypothetical protein
MIRREERPKAGEFGGDAQRADRVWVIFEVAGGAVCARFIAPAFG